MNEDYFEGKGYRHGDCVSLSPRQAYEFLQHGAILVDLRDEYETQFRKFDVPDVIYIQKNEFLEKYSQLPKDRPLILADNAGNHSPDLVEFLMTKGYRNAAVLIGGILEWANDRMPMKVNRDYELNGQCSCKLRTRKFRSHDHIGKDKED